MYPNPYRRCAGTMRSVWEAELPADGSDTTVIKRIEGESVPGCGQVVQQTFIPATPAAEGERPLFKKGANVVICPHCDGPGAVVTS